jgi:hypothetical protein
MSITSTTQRFRPPQNVRREGLFFLFEQRRGLWRGIDIDRPEVEGLQHVHQPSQPTIAVQLIIDSAEVSPIVGVRVCHIKHTPSPGADSGRARPTSHCSQ